MPDYILLMHNDTVNQQDDSWGPYLAGLQAAGVFQGGSAIGNGICVRKLGTPPRISGQLTGFIRVRADGMAHAQALLAGNPVFESGGSIEIRELPESE